jgi:hypothetical protein
MNITGLKRKIRKLKFMIKFGSKYSKNRINDWIDTNKRRIIKLRNDILQHHK